MRRLGKILWLVIGLTFFSYSMAFLMVDVMVYQGSTAGGKIWPALWVVFDLLLVGGLVTLSALDLWMVSEVNRSVTEGFQLDYCRWSWDTPKVEDLYKQLYPDSKVNRAHRILWLVYAPFLLAGAFRIRFDSSGRPDKWATYTILVLIAVGAIASILKLLRK